VTETKKFWPAVKDFCKRADMLLLGLCVVCSVFGIVVIHSATLTYTNPNKFVFVQLLSLILGIGAFVVLTVVDAELIADKWMYLCIFDVAIMLLLIPLGVDAGTGNKSWLRFFGIGIQPSEVVKIVFIIILAKQVSYLKEYKDLNSGWSVLQLVVHFVLLFGLIVGISSDLGSALIIMFIFIVVVFAAGIKWYWIGIGFAAVAALIPFAWNHLLKPYQKNRILAPYDSSIDPTGDSITWQANQSKMALASGRLTGTGLGQGTQTQSKALTGKHTDFIFAVIGEELGLIACVIVLLLLTAIIIRCCVIGVRSGSNFNMLMCFGVGSAIAFQTFINVGMCMGITPVIGITLPFFSYGGSSMFTLFAAMGLVSGVKYRRRPRRFSIEY
jgi:rod shape determining protein RodA